MKRTFYTAFLSLSLCGFSATAKADTWGCEVLLCLANPSGVMAAPACVAPIKKLYKALYKWRPDPFPRCKEAETSNDNTTNYAQVTGSYYDDCPSGSEPIGEGVLASSSTYANYLRARTQNIYANTAYVIGTGNLGTNNPVSFDLPNKYCGRTFYGNAAVIHAYRLPAIKTSVAIYAEVITLTPRTPSEIVIFIGGQPPRTINFKTDAQ